MYSVQKVVGERLLVTSFLALRAAAARRYLAMLSANLGRRFLPSPYGYYFLIELFIEEMVNY
ncbi:hypothetical protein FORC065_2324 [Yersinia enterocolitica]|nr:hypothetical protein FORC065_2324 [Yersinia enterocolitica]